MTTAAGPWTRPAHARLACTRTPGPCSPGRRRGGTPPACSSGRGPQHAHGSSSQFLPTVDWSRFHLQVLFVDRTDTVRGRFAVGMFERISEWNGHSRIMVASPCGVAADGGSAADLSLAASLMRLAAAWDMRPRLFAGTRQRFEEEDIDRFDLIVCTDSSVQAAVLSILSSYRPAAPGSYVTRVCSLTDFLAYCPEERLFEGGGSGLLDRKLRLVLRERLPCLRHSPPAAPSSSGGGGTAEASAPAAPGEPSSEGGSAAEVPQGLWYGREGGGCDLALPSDLAVPWGVARPSTADPEEQWHAMVATLALCVAGLVSYLADSYPEQGDPDVWD